MTAWRFLFLALFTVLSAYPAGAWAQNKATIPLTDQRMPSDDLFFEGRVLRADEAQRLRDSGVDLSKLDPAESSMWSPGPIAEGPDALPVNNGDVTEYSGPLLSATGMFRFNIRAGRTNAIVHLDKTLHTVLLRKNLLRRMGYHVPPMKWLKTLTVRFPTLNEMKDFLESRIPRATLGADSRWVTKKDENGFSVVMQDVVVTVPGTEDSYNPAMGVPPRNLTGRTMRSLIIPYALLDLGESVNSFEWTVGRITNNQVSLPHFTLGVFTTTLADAQWALNILARFSVEDFREMVEMAHYPPEVSALLVEKLAARRNALMTLFKAPVAPLEFNLAVSQGKNLVQGKLTRQDWPGYASRFAYGDPESPFKDFHWYALAKIQALTIDNLVDRANKELQMFNPNEVRTEFFMDQFKKGLDHFVETGEFLQFPVETWVSPTGGLDLTLSRDVVVGNYLGTDNLVQLADSIGYSASLGGQMGIENVPNFQTVSARASMSISQNWTHLKPLRNLKNVFKEPYKNVVVPLIKLKLARTLDRLEKLSQSQTPDVDWDIKKDDSALSKVIAHLNKSLGVGESILYTERLAPTIGGSVNTSLMGSPVTFKLNASTDMVEVRRVQIYRKDSKTLQIYDDVGHGTGWSLDTSLERFIPIVRLGLRRQTGDYTVRLHEVDINADLKENPKLFTKAHALAEFIQEGSSELLEAIQAPHLVKADYGDTTTRLGFLFWRYKKLKADTTYDIKSRQGLAGRYVTFSDERQTGLNWESFVKDIINFGLSEASVGVAWASPAFQNPAQTLTGVGHTKGLRFEAKLEEDGSYSKRFMRLTDRWEGWSAKVAEVKEHMRKVNAKFGSIVFDEATLHNTTKLKLFDVAVNLNLYERGLARLAQLSEDSLSRLENRYEVERGIRRQGCERDFIKERRLADGRVIESCGTLHPVILQHKLCRSAVQKLERGKDASKCLMKFFRALYEHVDYRDIEALLGSDNLFVHGSVNGFRNGDEVLNDPIQSNTQGRIGDDKDWNGLFDRIQQLLGIQSGELNGYWLRDKL